MAMTSRAKASWRGSLFQGAGHTSAGSSAAFEALPLTWRARTEAHDGQTSPEELLAAAHASCFAMAFANGLAQAGNPAEQLDVEAVVTFGKVEAGWRILTSALTVSGKVPGIDVAAFKAAAEAAKTGCPVSQALKGNVELTVNATLV